MPGQDCLIAFASWFSHSTCTKRSGASAAAAASPDSKPARQAYSSEDHAMVTPRHRMGQGSSPRIHERLLCQKAALQSPTFAVFSSDAFPMLRGDTQFSSSHVDSRFRLSPSDIPDARHSVHRVYSRVVCRPKVVHSPSLSLTTVSYSAQQGSFFPRRESRSARRLELLESGRANVIIFPARAITDRSARAAFHAADRFSIAQQL